MTTTKPLPGIPGLATLWLGWAPLPSSAAELKAAKVDPRVSFKNDAGGEVTGLVLHERDDHEAKKIR